MYLEAINLSKKYGKFYALRNLNLKLEGNKCLGYLGPNGAGKTTTLKLFTNLLRPTSGEAIIDSFSVKGDVKKALKNVGTLIETPNFYPYLTPVEALSMLCDIRGSNKRDIKNALEEVKLYDVRNKRIGKFSKGMIQRLAVAAALVTNPSILILDEPTTGLDPQGMAEIRETIRSLRKDGKMILMSSHLLPEVTEVCDEVAMINNGRLVLYDTIDNVTQNFSINSVVVEFLEPVKDVKSIEDMEHVRKVSVLTSQKIRIAFDGNAKEQSNILATLISKGYKVLSYKSETLALEKAYLKLIGGIENE